PMELLAGARVHAVGQAVAAVVAGTRAEARDAVEVIGLEVAEDEAPRSGGMRAEWGRPLPEFAPVVTARIDHALLAPFALEPRAALAEPVGEGLRVWLSTQTPQRGRDDLAAILGLPRAAVHVIAPDVGGAFGGKASLMPEDAMVALAALRLGRPVKWTADRGEEFLAATQGRGGLTTAELAVDDAGRATGLRADLAFPLGHWMPYSTASPLRNTGRILPGPYDIPVHVTGEARMTEGAAVNIYRGAGRPEAVILMERLMDRAAQARSLDPIAIRRRNIPPSPPRPGPDRPCSGDYAGLLDRLEAETGYADLRARQAQRRADGELCGLGVALYAEPCGQGWETASLALTAEGRFAATTGSSAQGQGRETAMAQIVADGLGIDPALVDVSEGDTATTPDGIGALASRSTAIGGTAMWRAAAALGNRMLAAGARVLNVAEGDLHLAGDGLHSRDGQSLGWADLARRAGPLRVDIRHEAEAEAWASGAILAEIGIDPDTGTPLIERITWVDDAGTVINPLLVAGQLIGGAAQGIGAALLERIVYRDGQLLTGSLMDYALPRAVDMPPLRIVSLPTPSPANALGVKGVGEAGCIGIPAAILNAVMDALPPDTPDLSFPLTPEKIWRALNGMSHEI
ncbi:MAG: xanthine dehydrogenase family protein molybdopterin-binding subunit, partial [Pseudorhodobacter sp.]